MRNLRKSRVGRNRDTNSNSDDEAYTRRAKLVLDKVFENVDACPFQNLFLLTLFGIFVRTAMYFKNSHFSARLNQSFLKKCDTQTRQATHHKVLTLSL